LLNPFFVFGGGKLAVEKAERLARMVDGLIVREKSGPRWLMPYGDRARTSM
jgi:hypothetical protein